MQKRRVTETVALLPETKQRLTSLRTDARRTYDEIVRFLLCEHDARAASNPNASGQERPGLVERLKSRTATGSGQVKDPTPLRGPPPGASTDAIASEARA